MRKIVLLSSVLLLALSLLVGCGASGAAPANSPASTPLLSTEKDPADSSFVAPPASVSGEEKNEQTLTGVIDDMAMNQMWVELSNGEIINIVYEDADVTNLKDSMPGAKITVTYTGTLDGSNTDNMTVTSIENAA